MPETPQVLCSLCQRTPHNFPSLALYNLTCPGEKAAPDVQSYFVTKMAHAKAVHAQYGITVASNPGFVKSIMARRDAWEHRMANPMEGYQRSAVTHDELQDACNVLTPITAAMVGREMLRPEPFDVDIPHLQKLRDPLPPSLKLTKRETTMLQGSKGKENDFMLFDVGGSSE
jgi:hypothetical protein